MHSGLKESAESFASLNSTSESGNVAGCFPRLQEDSIRCPVTQWLEEVQDWEDLICGLKDIGIVLYFFCLWTMWSLKALDLSYNFFYHDRALEINRGICWEPQISTWSP